MFDGEGNSVALQEGDVIFLKVDFQAGKVLAEVERNDTMPFFWSCRTERGELFYRRESFTGIMCPSEIKRALMFMARAFGLNGTEEFSPDDERKRLGWMAFRFI